MVYLAVGETRKLKLTAPSGEYTVKVDDGTGQNNLVFNGVSLTGNVIGNSTTSNLIGIILFLIGIIGAFFYFKRK